MFCDSFLFIGVIYLERLDELYAGYSFRINTVMEKLDEEYIRNLETKLITNFLDDAGKVSFSYF